jgi:CRISPR-associated endonuclease/helicase Cas3
MNYLSHPTQKLTQHIANIQAYDLEDKLFIKSVLFHDLGKVLDSFQAYIQKQRKDSEPHAPISGVIYLLNQIGNNLEIKKEDLFIFNSIISHHGKLRSFYNPDGGYDILSFFTIDIPTQGVEEIYNKEDVVAYANLISIDTGRFRKLRRKNRKMRFDIEDYITQKLLFSKLIFADKYEAIYKSSHQKRANQQSVKLLHQELAKIIKQKDPKRDEVKNSILNAYDKSHNIFTLTAPTGIGKMLTSLELALKIKEDKKLEKIIYILPFTSIIDQTYEIFDKLFPNQITKHHYAVEFKEGSEEKNSYDRWKFILNSWDDP